MEDAAPARPGATGASAPRVTPIEELDKTRYVVPWRKFANPDLVFVNKRAYFDYQRQRVYVRGNAALRRRYHARDENRNRKGPAASRRVQIIASRCPACGKRNLDTVAKPTTAMGIITRSKRTFHLQITELGIKRQVIDCRTTIYRCRDCGHHFTPERYHRLARYSHAVMSWVTYQSVVPPPQHISDPGDVSRLLRRDAPLERDNDVPVADGALLPPYLPFAADPSGHRSVVARRRDGGNVT